jgi:hypothetical protein
MAQNRSKLSRRPRRKERESVHQGEANRLARSRRNIRYPRDWQPANNIPELGKSHKKNGLNGEERNIAFRSSQLHIQRTWLNTGQFSIYQAYLTIRLNTTLAFDLRLEYLSRQGNHGRPNRRWLCRAIGWHWC